MRVRKIAKQLKRWDNEAVWGDCDSCEPIFGYRIGGHEDKISHILRMTRKHYFGLMKKYSVGSMMYQLYTHKANSYDLYDEVLEFWGIRKE